LDILDCLIDTEHRVLGAIRGCFPRSWDENYITYQVLHELLAKRKFEFVTDRSYKVHWDAVKLKGRLETDNGDIAVLVKFTSWAGEETNGVAFYEAKRRYPLTQKFDMLKKPQLENIIDCTRYPNILLYDYESTIGFHKHIFNYYDIIRYQNAYRQFLETQSLVVQPPVILSTNGKGTDLYKYALPFVHQLICRNLQCLDLDTRDKVVGGITRFFEDNGIGGPQYVLMVGVSQGSFDPTLPEIPGGYENFIG